MIVSKDLKIFYAAKYLVAIGYRLLTMCVCACVIVMSDICMYPAVRLSHFVQSHFIYFNIIVLYVTYIHKDKTQEIQSGTWPQLYHLKTIHTHTHHAIASFEY